MSTSQRARLAAFKDMHASQNGSGAPTFQLSDAEAVEILAELELDGFELDEHAEVVTAGVALLAAVGPPPASKDEDALADWAMRKREASQKLWDGLSGCEIDGVVIIRKRS